MSDPFTLTAVLQKSSSFSRRSSMWISGWGVSRSMSAFSTSSALTAMNDLAGGDGLRIATGSVATGERFRQRNTRAPQATLSRRRSGQNAQHVTDPRGRRGVGVVAGGHDQPPVDDSRGRGAPGGGEEADRVPAVT